MSGLCALFGYTLEEGTKAFCIMELAMSYIHCLISLCIVRLAVVKYVKHGTEWFGAIRWVFFLLYTIFMITLFIQGILGCLLYFVGYRRGKLIVFYLWIGVALYNFLSPLLILIMQAVGEMKGSKDLAEYKGWLSKSIVLIFLYLLYNNFGIVTVFSYVKNERALKKKRRVEVNESVTEQKEPDPSGVENPSVPAAEVHAAEVPAAVVPEKPSKAKPSKSSMKKSRVNLKR